MNVFEPIFLTILSTMMILIGYYYGWEHGTGHMKKLLGWREDTELYREYKTDVIDCHPYPPVPISFKEWMENK